MQADGKALAVRARRAASTGRCRRTTSRRSRRCATRSTRQQANPARAGVRPRATTAQPLGDEPGEVFPYVFTTYRLTEHHTAGGMSRWLPYLTELQPEFFCEVSPRAGRASGGSSTCGWATIVTARTAIEARVLVTERMRPLRLGGRYDPPGRPALPLGRRNGIVHRRLGQRPVRRRRSTRTCTSRSPRSATCDIRPGRRPRGPALLAYVEDYRRRAGVTGERQRPMHRTASARDRLGGDQLAAAARSGPTSRPTPGWRATHPPRMGFFTDTSVCIGCKACEVACKEWNARPRRRLSTARDVLRQHRRARRQHLAARRVHRAASRSDRQDTDLAPARRRRLPASGLPRGGPPTRPRPVELPDADRGRRAAGVPLADVVGRVQALHPRRPASTSARPARCSAPSSAPSSCRTTSATAAATACRPARTASSTPRRRGRQERRHRPQVHAVLRPARRRPDARRARRPAPPSRSSSATLDELRERAAGPASATLHERASTEARLYGARPRRRRRRRRGVLPAARRARGLRPAAGPGRDHPRPAADVAARRPGRGRAAGRCASRCSSAALMSPAVGPQRSRRPATPATRRCPAARADVGDGRRRPRRRGGVAAAGRALDGAGGGVHVLLRPPDHQAAAVGDPTSRPTCSSAASPPARRCWRAGADLTGRPALRTHRPARGARWPCSLSAWSSWSTTSAGPSALPQHAARVQADLAAVGGLLDPHRLRPVRRAAAAAEIVGRCRLRCRAAAACSSACWRVRPGWSRRVVAPAVATYTAVLLANTADPAWHEAHRELPFVFVGSAAAAAGGLGMVGARSTQAGPARRLAVGGALARARRRAPMERSDGHRRRAAAPGPRRRG